MVPQQQENVGGGGPRGYVRMAVMDGKTVGHRVRCISKYELNLFKLDLHRYARLIPATNHS